MPSCCLDACGYELLASKRRLRRRSGQFGKGRLCRFPSDSRSMHPSTHQSDDDKGMVKLPRGGRGRGLTPLFQIRCSFGRYSRRLHGRHGWRLAGGSGCHLDGHSWAIPRGWVRQVGSARRQTLQHFRLRWFVARPLRRRQQCWPEEPCSFTHGRFHFPWPISMPLDGSMGCTPEVREQAGSAMVPARRIGSGRYCQRFVQPSSRRRRARASGGAWIPGSPGVRRDSRCDGNPAIRFRGWQVVSHTVCRAGCAAWKHAGVDVDAHLHGLIGCRTGAAAGGAQIGCDTGTPQSVRCACSPILGHILLLFPDLVPCDTSSRAARLPQLLAEPMLPLSNAGRRTMGPSGVEQHCFTSQPSVSRHARSPLPCLA